MWSGEEDNTDFIFRLADDGKIVKHSDVLQMVPEQAANGNTMF
jgi:predicted SnoaL-like aldol condensation-catalyzing enzyme